MSLSHYILDAAGEPVAVDDVIDRARWFERAKDERIVGRTEAAVGVTVSTVFLGLDHRFGPGEPLLWETMIFGGPRDQATWRYSTRAEAEAGHRHACEVAPLPEDDDSD